ncbi:MAG: hypothetical protein Q8P67_16185, partial [archaeon]|nr:hypothetical protein [archaeon]
MEPSPDPQPKPPTENPASPSEAPSSSSSSSSSASSSSSLQLPRAALSTSGTFPLLDDSFIGGNLTPELFQGPNPLLLQLTDETLILSEPLSQKPPPQHSPPVENPSTSSSLPNLRAIPVIISEPNDGCPSEPIDSS